MSDRRLKIKKLVLLCMALALFSFSLVTCDLFDPGLEMPGSSGKGSSPSRAPSTSSFTVYLDNAPPSASRAISKSLAIFAHDFFEVVFVGADNTVARAAWERNQPAVVTGVKRNVDYKHINAASLPSDEGAALLFVGKRSDKTLLGIGRLTATDDGGDVTYISEQTKSLTFSVYAIKAGTSDDVTKSSFLTSTLKDSFPFDDASEANTEIVPVFTGGRDFPLYRMELDRLTSASYRFGFDAASAPNFSNFGIILAQSDHPDYTSATLVDADEGFGIPGNPVTRYRLRPRSPSGTGGMSTYIYDSTYLNFDEKTTVQVTNNLTAGQPFNNPVTFTINTLAGIGNPGTENGNVFAFAFEVPVYALSNGGDPVKWFIRPGYDNYLKDICPIRGDDQGLEGTGGAILIGSGFIDNNIDYNLFVIPPHKYNYFHNNRPDDFILDLTGIIILMRIGVNHILFEVPVSDSTPLPTPPLPNAPSLRFYLGGVKDEDYRVVHGSDVEEWISLNPLYWPSTPRVPYRELTSNNNKTAYLVDVLVEYDYTNDENVTITYTSGFSIILTEDISDFLPSLDTDTRKVVSAGADLTDFYTTLVNGRTYLLLFFFSTNLSQITINASNCTFIIMAAAPDVTIGKLNGDGNGFIVWGDNNTFIFTSDRDEAQGLLDDPIQMYGLPIPTYAYTIHSSGRYDGLPNQYAPQWFIRNQNNQTITVHVQPPVAGTPGLPAQAGGDAGVTVLVNNAGVYTNFLQYGGLPPWPPSIWY